MKKIGIVFGNGVTIDLIKNLNKDSDIEPTDLFRFGDVVKWPATDEPGFLSPRFCPNLWRLGARPGLNRKESYKIIEELITVINLYATLPKKTVMTKTQKQNSQVFSTYIHAYHELVSYLRELFINYNSKVSDVELKNVDWGWKDYLLRLDKNDDIEKVDIITYNYDIFLERVLDILNIKFSIPGIKQNGGKFNIYKPHGSIGFLHKKNLPKGDYNIPSSYSINNGSLADIYNDYINLTLYMPAIPLIPPAGEADRFGQYWAKEIRDMLIEEVSSFNDRDEFIICGLSYWHVDRSEIDEIIRNINCDVKMRMINPGNVEGLSSVLSMVFDNYIHHSSSKILKELN
ncbi:hypothetical protein [Dickeya lacustris]|uniref:SIR2-like domain-containing protein n=1 Tax=Dickeya lacustris TaxID=2259638 RepID=A0ABY8G5E3_9GAMM|nr:hypothetical protein [Dickeya lacustris]WFN55134.1 hypothetical protein O1Q98_16100 [Dickeya lacustris]